jgi:hypothetical protein
VSTKAVEFRFIKLSILINAGPKCSTNHTGINLIQTAPSDASFVLFNNLSSKTGQKTGDKGEERSKKAVAKADKKGAEASNKARDKTTNNANNQDENLGKNLEDGVQNRVELRSDAKSGNKTLDDGGDFWNKRDEKSLDGADIRVGDVEAGSAGKLLDEAGNLVQDAVELRKGLVSAVILGRVTALNLIEDVT